METGIRRLTKLRKKKINDHSDKPIIDTRTGEEFRHSDSGGVMVTVRTDPKLVPSHRVGTSADGSEKKL